MNQKHHIKLVGAIYKNTFAVIRREDLSKEFDFLEVINSSLLPDHFF